MDTSRTHTVALNVSNATGFHIQPYCSKKYLGISTKLVPLSSSASFLVVSTFSTSSSMASSSLVIVSRFVGVVVGVLIWTFAGSRLGTVDVAPLVRVLLSNNSERWDVLFCLLLHWCLHRFFPRISFWSIGDAFLLKFSFFVIRQAKPCWFSFRWAVILVWMDVVFDWGSIGCWIPEIGRFLNRVAADPGEITPFLAWLLGKFSNLEAYYRVLRYHTWLK